MASDRTNKKLRSLVMVIYDFLGPFFILFYFKRVLQVLKKYLNDWALLGEEYGWTQHFKYVKVYIFKSWKKNIFEKEICDSKITFLIKCYHLVKMTLIKFNLKRAFEYIIWLLETWRSSKKNKAWQRNNI